MSRVPLTYQVELGLFGSYDALILADGPLGYWRLGDAVGSSIAADSSGNGYTGSVVGGVTFGQSTEMPSGDTAALFDGSSGYLSFGNVLDITTGDFTLEAWVNWTNNGASQFIFSKGVTGGQGYGMYLASTGQLSLFINDAIGGILNHGQGAGLSAGWHHVVISVVRSASASFYIDGGLVIADTAVTAHQGSLTTATGLFIGRQNAASLYFDGLLYKCAIYDYALSSAQVTNHYTCGRWTDVSADVIWAAGVASARGMPGNSPVDRVATRGTLTFSLYNRGGLYAPDGASVWSGFGYGIPVRLLATDGATDWPIWRGRLATILPIPGVRGTRRTECTAQDTMGDLADTLVKTIPPQTNQSETALLTAILAALPSQIQPVATSFDTALDVYPYAFNDLGSGVPALDAATRVLDSSQGYLFQTADGTLRYINRHTVSMAASLASFDESTLVVPDGVVVASDLTNVYNRIQATSHPKTVDPATVIVLFAAAARVAVAPGETVVVNGTYRDPTNPARILGGTNFQALVSGTDYSANTAADGTGADQTSKVTVTVAISASTAAFTLTNAGAVLVYVAFQIRGTAIYDNDPITSEAYRAEAYGDRPLPIDLSYQADPQVGQSFADYLLSQYSRLTNQISAISFRPRQSSALRTQAVTREIGDVITVSESQTGLTGATATIVGVEFAVTPTRETIVTYQLAPRQVFRVFLIDDVVLGQIDNPGVIIGYA